MNSVDIAIVGGGVVGLVAANVFAAAGYSIKLLEPQLHVERPQHATELRCYALTPATVRVLEGIGAWARVDHARVGSFRAMEVWDAASPGRIEFDAPRTHDGAMGWIIEHSNLVAALLEVSAARDEIALSASEATTVSFAQLPFISASDGAAIHPRLVIGADGARSRIREAAGICSQAGDFRQSAVVCNVRTQQPHGRVARQRFLATGPVAFLPLADDYESSVVWTCAADFATWACETSDDGFSASLATAFDARLGSVDATSARVALPLQRFEAAHYVAPGCALIGDAAHVIHPLAGQGLNLGVLDVVTLKACIGDNDAGAGVIAYSRLRRFERWRRSETLAMATVTAGLNKLFATTHPLLRYGRGAGMLCTNRVAPLKAWLVARAMGIAGDLPG